MNKRIRKVPPKSEFRDAILLNNDTYRDYLERIKKIALSMFVWENLPDTMNSRYLEMCLYYKGQAALLYDNDYGFINTQAADSGYINIYGLPTLLNCYSYSYNSTRNLYVPDSGEGKDGECILVMNTFERVPTCATVELFAYRLSQAQRSADTNVAVTRSSQLLLTDQKQYFTLKKMYEEYDGNTPAIFADRNLITPDSIKAIKTDTPIMLKELMDYKREIWNECLTALGVSNLNEKRERMVSAETDSNNEVVNLNLQSFLVPRQKAAEEFNKKFGLTGDKAIKVRVRSDLYNLVKQYDSIAGDYESLLKEDMEVSNG